jgi:adenosylcobyric acid synthase
VEVSGLGLLPVDTVFASTKIVRAVSGRHVESGLPVSGYQVRMGRTLSSNTPPYFVELHDSKELELQGDGISICGGRLFGTYLHGLFESDPFRRWWLNGLRTAKGWASISNGPTVSLDARLDRWADFVEEHVSMTVIDSLVDGND